MNHLLAATDLSAPARHAVERAVLVCQQTGTPLELLHVANLAPLDRLRQLVGSAPDTLQQQVLDSAWQALNEQAAAFQSRFGVQPVVRVVQGNVLVELAQAVDAHQVDLVVCGARGESFLRHALLGSTAERMLGRTKCPMLVVKQVPHEPYRRVLVPVDFSAHSLRALRQARAVAPGAALVLLHAVELPFEGRLRYASVGSDIIERYRKEGRQEAGQRMQQLIQDASLSPQDVVPLVLHGNPSMLIREQEQELNCDLIAIGKHGDSLLEDFFLGGVTKHVLAESQCDVLVSV